MVGCQKKNSAKHCHLCFLRFDLKRTKMKFNNYRKTQHNNMRRCGTIAVFDMLTVSLFMQDRKAFSLFALSSESVPNQSFFKGGTPQLNAKMYRRIH